MGINSIKCKGSYAETGKTEFGIAKRTSSDFDTNDLVSAIVMLGGMTFVGLIGLANWVSQYAPESMRIDKEPKERTSYKYNEIHDSFIADKSGDMSSLDGHNGMKYTTIFRGIEHDEHGILKVHADVIGKNPSGLEETKHVIVEDYKLPQTYGEATRQYNNIMANGSTPATAILDFEDVKVGSFTRSVGDFFYGNFEKLLSESKVTVYAKIETDTKASITTMEGRIVPPQERDYSYNSDAAVNGGDGIIFSQNARSMMPPMPGVPTFSP